MSPTPRANYSDITCLAARTTQCGDTACRGRQCKCITSAQGCPVYSRTSYPSSATVTVIFYQHHVTGIVDCSGHAQEICRNLRNVGSRHQGGYNLNPCHRIGLMIMQCRQSYMKHRCQVARGRIETSPAAIAQPFRGDLAEQLVCRDMHAV